MITETKNIARLIEIRTNDTSEPLELYLETANELEKGHQPERAEFIRQQCNGLSGQELFDKYRESWGIPNFVEGLITVDDFERGFLWKFRDHTTSWSDNQNAKEWFLNSIEARFVRRYEFWSCDNGFEECVQVKEGSYKEILHSLLQDTDFEVLKSKVFSKSELKTFLDSYDGEKKGDFTKDELVKMYLSENYNWTNQ